jgi:class 3 adenylate cyclase
VSDTCPRCGTPRAPSQRFCGGCGAPLARRCRACGTENPPDFRFCGTCGAALEPPPEPFARRDEVEERRWATVLFADLSGFTNLSERSDVEDVRDLVDRCARLLGEVVARYGGSVDSVIGDAVLAVFGAPVAHEDDAERAVRAALEMQQRSTEEADAFGSLPLRVGVNTGEVMFAPVGPDGRRGQTVLGDVVNTAARLQTSAPVGTVLVGEATWRESRRAIRYDAVEPFFVKGKQDPLYAWVARDVVAAPADRPVSDVPMVGRERELDVLRSAWARVVVDRQPQSVAILGPAGIGKTRLGREFRTHLEAHGVRVLVGRCLPYGESAGYGAFAALVKAAAGIFESDSLDQARAKLRALVSGLVPGAEGEDVDRQLGALLGFGHDELVTNRRDLFSSVRRLVEALADEQPTVFGFDDIHWAEPSLLDLLEFLAGRVRDVPALFVVTARPELFDTRPNWGGGLPRYTAIAVDALTDADARRMAVGLLPDPAPEVVERLREVAGGNPLFIEELAASLAEGTTDRAGTLPTSLKGIITARIDALPDAERRVVLDASVVGKVFWRGAVAALGGEEGLDDALDSLEARDFIRRLATSHVEGDAEFGFRHILLPEVAYETLPKAARRERHATVARLVEVTMGDRERDVAPILAHHWREAGDNERAVRYLLAAAEQAGRGWAKWEAAALYAQALELIPEEDVAARRRARVQRAIALQASLHAALGDVTPPADLR